MKHRILQSFLFFIFTCSVAWTQAVSTAQIGGVVKDQTGAVLPGAEVTMTQTETGLKRSVLTDETGSYTMPNLPIGPYRFEVALPGFRTYVQTGIVLQVSADPVINAVLEVGQVSETIEVQANATLVETRSTGIGQVIDNQRVLELPLNGRQVTELVLLSGMATVRIDTGGLNPGTRNYPTTIISVAGGMVNGLTYLLDGGTHNDPWNNLNLPLPFPDALQEFKVETSALPAQFGHDPAAAVNAVTKAGTNEANGRIKSFPMFFRPPKPRLNGSTPRRSLKPPPVRSEIWGRPTFKAREVFVSISAFRERSGFAKNSPCNFAPRRSIYRTVSI